MSIKIAVVKTGAQIITKVEEMMMDEKVVGYFFNKPCLIETTDPIINKKSGNTSFDIKLKPWISLSKGNKFPVPLDWIVTFADPVDDLNLMYQTDVLKITEDTQEQNIILQDDCRECSK
jgi:hypothetical protein